MSSSLTNLHGWKNACPPMTIGAIANYEAACPNAWPFLGANTKPPDGAFVPCRRLGGSTSSSLTRPGVVA